MHGKLGQKRFAKQIFAKILFTQGVLFHNECVCVLFPLLS